MSGWLSRAKDALSGHAAESVPDPIELACPCGRKIEALRRKSFQRVLCKGCGESFFVLPRDVYPRLVLKKVRKVKPAKASTSAESAAAPKNDRPTEAAPARPAIDLVAGWQRAISAVRRQFTPLRLIVLSLLTVIGLTGWWQWNRAARSRAEVDFTAALEAGQAALQKKEFSAAAQEFGRATHAVDLLQRTDAPAQQARQRYRELTAINSLLQRSLSELLEAARTAKQTGGPAAAESEFAHLHAGRWIVVQTEITPPATPGGSLTPWEQRVQTDDGVLLLTTTLSAFAKVPLNAPAAGQAPPNVLLVNAPLPTDNLGLREIIFAAQVQSLRCLSPEQSVWIVTLNPQTGFLWSDYDLLLETGLARDEARTEDEVRIEAQLKALLTEQSRWIGVIQ